MKTTLIGFSGIALGILALVSVPIDLRATPDPANASAKTETSGNPSSPENQFLAAYNSMSTADVLKGKGLLAEAEDLYTEALDFFVKISADYPQWQPAVVAFRINYCREALKRLQDPARENKAPDNGQPSIQRSPSGESAATDDGISGTNNLSPLNFKLQQAAFKERSRDYTGALAMYTALLEEFPLEPWALKGACRCYLRLGRLDQARQLTRQSLNLPAPDAELNLLAALVDCQDGRYQAAIPLLRKSLKQNNTCPETHVALGVALAATGATQEAQEEMKRALSLNPKLGDAFYNLARLSLQQKPRDFDTARVHYKLALRNGTTPDPELDKLLAE